MSSISIIIPTLDEELHVGRAVASAAPLGLVHVLDSGSADKTRELAQETGATVAQHPWSGYATQKNWALANLGIESEWVLFLDADEYLTPELREEIANATTSGKFDGYYIPRQNIFLGRLLRHAWWYPDYQLRLFRARKGRYEDRLVHEHVLLDGKAGFLKQPIMHENLKGIDAFLERHRRYAAFEAAEMLRIRSGDFGDQRRGRFFGSWPEPSARPQASCLVPTSRSAGDPVSVDVSRQAGVPRRKARSRLLPVACGRGGADQREAAGVGARTGSGQGEAGRWASRSLSGSSSARAAVNRSRCSRTPAGATAVGRCIRESREYRSWSPPEEDATVEHEVSTQRQREYFDRENDAAFEITRPHGTPRLHQWLLADKFRRSVTELRPMVDGALVVSVCGGSGMDAEFLARAGATVVVADISLGAARRTTERARRFGLPIVPVVADATRLPLADRSVDIAYVHDGLHHLDRPFAGLAEMARVARRAVSVTEPARAAVTAAAVRVGLALEQEEAGNEWSG